MVGMASSRTDQNVYDEALLSSAFGTSRSTARTSRSTAPSTARLTEDALSRHVAALEEPSAKSSARASAPRSAQQVALSGRGSLTDRTNTIMSVQSTSRRGEKTNEKEDDALAKLAAENRLLQQKLLKQQILLLEEKAKRAQDIIDERRFARNKLEEAREGLAKMREDEAAKSLAKGKTMKLQETMRNMSKQPQKKLLKAAPFHRNSSIMRLRERELQRALEVYQF